MNLTSSKVDFNNHSRMDVLQAIGVPPSQMQPQQMQINQLENFPKDFPPATMSKKFFAPAYVYKHYYLADPGKQSPMMVMKPTKKKKEEEEMDEKDDSMLESFNPFGCESDEEDDDEEDDED